MKNKKNNRLFIIIMLISIVSGLMCDYFYQLSPSHVINVSEFQAQLNVKETKAAQTLEKMKEIITHTSIDSLSHYPFADDDISYYVFSKGEMSFWSDNNLDISSLPLPDSTNWHYAQLPNAHCVSRLLTFDSVKLLALIKVKNNYPYENNELINNFSQGFRLDKQINIVAGKITDKYAIRCSHGDYLFTLSEPTTAIYNETWAIPGLLAYALAFFVFFILYARFPYFIHKKRIKLNLFSIIAVGTGALVGICLYFNLPALLFWNKLFSPFQYASNPFLASISHLTIATGFIISTIYLFYFHTNTDSVKSTTTHAFLLVSFGLYFAFVYNILNGLIYHSSIQLNILQFNDISFISIWLHFLLLVLGIGLVMLFFKTHNWFKTHKRLKQALLIDLLIAASLFVACFFISRDDSIRLVLSYVILSLAFYLPYYFPKYKNIYIYVACWTFFYAAFVVINSLIINNDKKVDKYKVLAQNIYINGNTDNDRMADILLEELDVQILKDRRISHLVSKTDSLTNANNYLNRTYLRGFWNKYLMRLNATVLHSSVYNEYNQFIQSVGSRIKDTHFYSVPANENNMSYIGSFLTKPFGKDSIAFFMEFYPRRNFKSYSFPNLLIASSPDIQSKLNIAIAKYEHQRLVYSSGKIEYAADNSWIPNLKSDFFKTIYKNRIHYIYSPNSNTCIVITEQQPYDRASFVLYFAYTFLAFFSLCWLIIWMYLLTHQQRNYRLGLTAKFQYAFIGLLIISFLGIFYVSVDFIKKKYKEEQIANLENKKTYVQKALQDMYYWNQDLNALNTQALNFDLQDLSYIYHTDIHVYNNKGVLVGSSQPIIFNKNLISNRISPTAYFTPNANLNQYEHIGKLDYLTGYTDFYNGDFLQIGYIAIPQFFSQDEIRNEIESFLTVIIHIYLIIIVLAILLSLFIGQQLSAPLIVLENKLKEMRLGRRNEKIDYNFNDEIGQLVIQYNRTVDELEQSARLLAKSERESAWKSMARQVAHEINNPLTPMKLSIQQLQRTHKMNDGRFDDYFEKSTGMLIEQIDNLSRIAGTFSNFARMPEANFERVDIAARLHSAVQLFSNNNEDIQITYLGPKKDVFVYADPEQLVQVFNNLIKNAIQAIPDNREGEIEVKLNEDIDQIVILIIDNGVGIDNEVQDKLFVPNFTTKSTGMGLGLAIAKNIIEISGGTISFNSAVDEGTTFSITLPKA
ncbi:MAG: ATP-binding protein [Paludibacter sp.]|nr:ATP-binding protein [Paludibacter sp.]